MGWQAQDAEGALLRDQLRQAAHLWDERGRGEDLLWRGASYLDYRAWRVRYSGGVSALEGEFGRAMTALADRQRRRRRIAVATVVAALAIGLGVVGVFWARSEAARRQDDFGLVEFEYQTDVSGPVPLPFDGMVEQLNKMHCAPPGS